jgi:hypothetical protein
VLYGLCGDEIFVGQEAVCVNEETFVDELSSKEKGGCARDPL